MSSRGPPTRRSPSATDVGDTVRVAHPPVGQSLCPGLPPVGVGEVVPVVRLPALQPETSGLVGRSTARRAGADAPRGPLRRSGIVARARGSSRATYSPANRDRRRQAPSRCGGPPPPATGDTAAPDTATGGRGPSVTVPSPRASCPPTWPPAVRHCSGHRRRGAGRTSPLARSGRWTGTNRRCSRAASPTARWRGSGWGRSHGDGARQQRPQQRPHPDTAWA